MITSAPVEDGFRKVDRRFFAPKINRDIAYADQPLKEGNVHLSAPHIYGTVLEALELAPNIPMTFLNAGSGSGYLTCLAATILGPRSRHYCKFVLRTRRTYTLFVCCEISQAAMIGVEIHKDVIDHCKEAIANWKSHYPPAQEISHLDLIHGNALQIDADKGESALGFDRIYIGAAIDKEELTRFRNLLSPGGILVGPGE